MRAKPQTIVLGDREWQVRPLTVAQVQAVEPLLFASAVSSGTVAAAVAIIKIALARDHAEAAAQLDDIEAGATEIAAALACVLRLGGFVASEDASPGEAGAG